MTHFALVCPPLPSHVRAFEAVGERLVARGHRATLVLPGEARGLKRSRAVELALLPALSRPPHRSTELATRRPTGPRGLLRTVRASASATDRLCAEGPELLRRIGADAILGDEMEPGAGILARHLELPQISIACALPVEADPALPPPFVDWPYDPSPEGLKRNRGAARVTRLFLSRQRRAIEEWSMRFGLTGLSTIEDCLSPDATIAQTVPGFDFPRRPSSRIRPVGPLREAEAQDGPLPFAVDPDRPLVYASLGTLQGHRLSLFRTIAEAASRIDVQLVIAHCGGLSEREAGSLPAHFVARDLPQRAVLARAQACITHGGLNTTLDALEFGVPLLAIPIAFDQPGVAARIEHSGAGLKLPRVLLTRRAVRSSLKRLLTEETFALRARALGREIATAGGADRAAELIEAFVPGLPSIEPPLAEAAE